MNDIIKDFYNKYEKEEDKHLRQYIKYIKKNHKDLYDEIIKSMLIYTNNDDTNKINKRKFITNRDKLNENLKKYCSEHYRNINKLLKDSSGFMYKNNFIYTNYVESALINKPPDKNKNKVKQSRMDEVFENDTTGIKTIDRQDAHEITFKNRIITDINTLAIGGASLGLIKKKLRKTIEKDGNRSILALKTINNRSKTEGRLDAFKAFEDKSLMKTWIATLDATTRPKHQELDGITIPVDELFLGQGEGPGDMGGDDDLNCRCTLIFTKDEAFFENSRRIYRDLNYNNVVDSYMDYKTYRNYVEDV